MQHTHEDEKPCRSPGLEPIGGGADEVTLTLIAKQMDTTPSRRKSGVAGGEM